MTPQDLEIYRLRLRVGLLERFCCNTLVGLVMTAGENLEGARMILETSLDDAEIEMRPAIPTSSDPALQALAHDEFREIVEGSKALIKSLR